MTNKKSKLKKVTIGAVTATVIASTIVTSIPFNVLTAKASEELNSTRLNAVGTLQSTSTNLIKNASFSGTSNWNPNAYWEEVQLVLNPLRPSHTVHLHQVAGTILILLLWDPLVQHSNQMGMDPHLFGLLKLLLKLAQF